MQLTLILFPIALAIYVAIIYLFVLLVKALRKYIKSKDVREEKKAVCRSLGEALKAHRTEKQMTQEFVAETLGVSRQAVSKWENGTSDPSTGGFCSRRRYGPSAHVSTAPRSAVHWSGRRTARCPIRPEDQCQSTRCNDLFGSRNTWYKSVSTDG